MSKPEEDLKISSGEKKPEKRPQPLAPEENAAEAFDRGISKLGETSLREREERWERDRKNSLI